LMYRQNNSVRVRVKKFLHEQKIFFFSQNCPKSIETALNKSKHPEKYKKTIETALISSEIGMG
jgi:hypothetical protein